MNGGFVSNTVCDACNTVVPAEAETKKKLEAALAETKLGIQNEQKKTVNQYLRKKVFSTCQAYTDSWY